MSKSEIRVITVAVALLASAGLALGAATLDASQGGAMVNKGGKGFKPVTGSVAVKTGDTVMVAPGASATLVYESGCRVPVASGQVVSVQFVPPCALGLKAPTVAPAPALDPLVLAAIAAGGGLAVLAVTNGWGSSNVGGSGNPGGNGNGGSASAQ
jgi:hypothetical protein